MKPYWAGARCLIFISYKRMEEKHATLGRTSFSHRFSYKRMEERMLLWAGPRCLIVFPYERMEEKDVILDRTLFALSSFPTKEWRRRMSSWTGPCFFVFDISYKRMEEKDVILDRPLSNV